MEFFKWSKKRNSEEKKVNEATVIGLEAKKKRKNSFVEKIIISEEYKKTREDVLMSLEREIVLKAITEESYDNEALNDIYKEFDKDDILLSEDRAALECLYKAIKQGNMRTYDTSNNKILEFLKGRPDNIVKLINVMIKDATDMNEHIHDEQKKIKDFKRLIADTYDDLATMVEDIQEKEEEQQQEL